MNAPGQYASHKEFKSAVNAAVFQEQRRAVDRYTSLRKEGQHARAERFLSTCIKPRSEFCVALFNEHHQRPCSDKETIQLLLDDLKGRAENDFPHDEAFTAELVTKLSWVRNTGVGNSVDSCPSQFALYSFEEVSKVCDAFCKSKSWNFCSEKMTRRIEVSSIRRLILRGGTCAAYYLRAFW